MNNIEHGEYLLAQFEKLTTKSKALIFSCDSEKMPSILEDAEYFAACCNSPIEEIFAVAYRIKIVMEGFPYVEALPLQPQISILANSNSYIADFLLSTEYGTKWFDYGNEYKLVIECDGHEFHEKTKAQVARRNQRDMDLKCAGYDVLHFSGSQIFRNPMECAEQTFDYFMQKIGKVELKA